MLFNVWEFFLEIIDFKFSNKQSEKFNFLLILVNK